MFSKFLIKATSVISNAIITDISKGISEARNPNTFSESKKLIAALKAKSNDNLPIESPENHVFITLNKK